MIKLEKQATVDWKTLSRIIIGMVIVLYAIFSAICVATVAYISYPEAPPNDITMLFGQIVLFLLFLGVVFLTAFILTAIGILTWNWVVNGKFNLE